MNDSMLVDWTPNHFHAVETGILLAKHRLHESALFDRENLCRVIDTHPGACFHVNTMGSDENRFEWREGDRNGTPADVLLQLVERGRLWLNVRNIMDHHRGFRDLINNLYDELEQNRPGFQADDRSANLLISSPRAMVHYHTDVPVNMLWHIQGTKRVWVYPPFDTRFLSQEHIEGICAGEFAEDLPFDTSFDKYALTFDVQPGQLITWPQNTPHRVTNLDSLNISLSTEHKNRAATRRINVHLANHWLRQNMGLACRSMDIHGPAAHLKQAVIRTVRMVRKFTKKPASQFTYPVTFRIDPNAPRGFVDLGQHAVESHEPGEAIAV